MGLRFAPLANRSPGYQYLHAVADIRETLELSGTRTVAYQAWKGLGTVGVQGQGRWGRTDPRDPRLLQ